jgi:2-dehydro-3-deoxygalactonokinase
MDDAIEARLIGLDWGTSSLRAYLLGESGRKISERSAPSGVMFLDRFILPGKPQSNRNYLFEAVLQEICQPWFVENPNLPAIACGMVGSTVGWKEAPYLQTPACIADLASALITVLRQDGKPVRIIPGISHTGIPGKTLPEILRGEETQIAGILSTMNESRQGKTGKLLIGLPGTHSKWAYIQDACLVSFSTFVTGDLFALLTSYSVVARTNKKTAHCDDAAFQLGLQLGRQQDQEAAGGLLSTIFSTRTKRVLGSLREEEQPDYLSGLLIGSELAGLEHILERDSLALPDFSRIILTGEKNLCERYLLAARALSWPPMEYVEGAVEMGLWSIAREAALVS